MTCDNTATTVNAKIDMVNASIAMIQSSNIDDKCKEQIIGQLTTLKKVHLTLIDKASENNPSDEPDFSADDYAGGNIDDAWMGGQEEGEVYYARSLLHNMF